MFKKQSSKFMRKDTLVAKIDDLPDESEVYQNITFIVRKRIFTSLHLINNIKALAKKSLNFLYHQIRMDYIDKNLLRRLSSYDDVSVFAACILKVKHWNKILRSKDNSLTTELILKNVSWQRC